VRLDGAISGYDGVKVVSKRKSGHIFPMIALLDACKGAIQRAAFDASAARGEGVHTITLRNADAGHDDTFAPSFELKRLARRSVGANDAGGAAPDGNSAAGKDAIEGSVHIVHIFLPLPGHEDEGQIRVGRRFRSTVEGLDRRCHGVGGQRGSSGAIGLAVPERFGYIAVIVGA
jgi:hypothetical protein